MAVTHQEIAERAGVSRALVTRALHRTHRSRVSPKTQQRIREVAREMGYEPRNFTSHNIGLVGQADALRLAGESRFVLLIDRALRSAGFRLLLTSLERDQKVDELREILNPKTVDGVIFTRWFGGKMQDVLPTDVPWVVVSDEDSIPQGVDKIVMDTATTAQSAAAHLISLGHRSLGIVSSRGKGAVTTHLKNGVNAALREADVHVPVSSIEVDQDTAIAEQMTRLMRTKNAPTGFVVFGPEKAVTTLNILQFLGYDVPQQISLISLLDSHLLEPLSPPITATTAMDEVVATRAVSRLFEKMNDPSLPARHILIPGQIIHRGSTGRLS